MSNDLKEIKNIVIEAAKKARQETSNEPEPDHTKKADWPVYCTVGPGLEGAIACESKIGYVNGSKGWLIYRGYDIFDLCAHSTFEEVSFLLVHGKLPNLKQLNDFKKKIFSYSHLTHTLRTLMGFPLEKMNAMAALRMGINLLRQEFTILDFEEGRPHPDEAIASDEDSIAMETMPRGDKHATFEFKSKISKSKTNVSKYSPEAAIGVEACYHLIAGVSTITAAISRTLHNNLPLEPKEHLSFAGNLIYMITGKEPTPVEERIMDIALILHADHGMNASTFAAMVVASTLSDMYFSIGSGIGALNGPLHGGANEEVIKILSEIGTLKNVKPWFKKSMAKKKKIVGFGHRVYKAYDPRARILGPLAGYLVKFNKEIEPYYKIANALEKEVIDKFGKEKKIFPNVDFYSGIVYSCLNIEPELFTLLFATSRVAGWTSRILEYLENNRIFRPRATYVGEFNNKYVPVTKR